MESERQVVIALLDLLKVLGLNQRTIATRLGVTESRVSHWKSGFRPIAKHQLEELSKLLHEAHAQDMRREDEAQFHLKTRQEIERWRLHKLAIKEAFKTYEVSLHRWTEQITPGISFEHLSGKAEALWQIMTGYMSCGVKSLTFLDRLLLSIKVTEFHETLRLMNVMESPTWADSEQLDADTQAAIERFTEIKKAKAKEEERDAEDV